MTADNPELTTSLT
jgi:hypothetical protein